MTAPFADKTVLLGVCGSIAAYKACELASRLVDHGATVLPALTRSARQLVGAASFEALTGNPVITDLFDPQARPEIEHIAVAQRADLFLIAPASANMLAKAARGIADDWLSTTLLATRAPLLFAPAMNHLMYTHPATQANLAMLRERGAFFVGPGVGKLACGDTAVGRMAETPEVLESAAIALCRNKDLSGKRILISSGANHEPLDPARFLGNRSSGKMGYALAFEALRRGAAVEVVTGPATVAPPYAASVACVQTAAEMFDAVATRFDSCDILISAAAVADFRAARPATQKIKRDKSGITLELTPNPDIVATLAARKRPNQAVVGFAAESETILDHARSKLESKGLDMIVANAIGSEGCAVGSDRADAWILARNREPETCPGMLKAELAARIYDFLLSLSAS